jgi:protein-glutamine gamma-glutamyltransferase
MRWRSGGDGRPDTAGDGDGDGRGMTWQRWDRLPREARDTLFQLGVIAWTLLPHADHLPLWCSLLAGTILLWRGRLALRGLPLPPRWNVVAVLAVAVALTWWSERTLLGREAGVTLLVMLMALKTLELRARRDALVVFFLGFFLVLTNFLYSQSMAVALSMLVSVWGLLTALVLAHMPVGRPPLARAAALSGRAALLGAPLMVLLFALFPRMAPLWGVPQDAVGRTGLSGSLQLGGVAEIANDDSIAMRVRFFGRVPSADQLYFRGPVLGSFDGRTWTRLSPTFPVSARPRNELQVFGTGVAYEVTLEPSRLALLPLLEMTPDRSDAAPVLEGFNLSLRADAQWQLDRPVTERVRVRARAFTEHRHGPRQSVLGLRDFVELPPTYNPRSLQWAQDLRNRPENAGADARRLADLLLAHVRSTEFIYTLEPGTYGRDAVDEFWFDRRLGFCEHFAASFVVMMRAMDVPARIVTGYQGTDPEPVDGYYIVRQSHAHAWAEYWQPGDGWVRVDPTAAVAPDRIQVSRNLQPAGNFMSNALGNVNPAMAAQVRRAWEALNNRWNQWVMNYSRGQQLDLLKELGFASPDWADLSYLLIGLLCAGSLAGVAWAWWDRQRQDPWLRLQQRVAVALSRLEVAVGPHDPPRTRAERVRQRLGVRGDALAAQLTALDQARYGSPPGGSPRLALRRWWRDFARAAARLGPP